MRQMLTLPVLVLLLATVVGCGGAKPIPVLVTLDGKPLEGATVVLSPEDGKGGATITGFTAADGTATLDSTPKGSLKAGNYKVLVTKTKTSGSSGPVDPAQAGKMMMGTARTAKSEIPTTYADLKSTPLTLTVPPPSTPAKIELKSK